MKIFSNTEELYKDNKKRRYSGEVDYGCWWISRVAPRDYFRVTWIRDTGEFYAIDLNTQEVYLLDQKAKTEEKADAIMEGWEKIPTNERYVERYFPEILDPPKNAYPSNSSNNNKPFRRLLGCLKERSDS